MHLSSKAYNLIGRMLTGVFRNIRKVILLNGHFLVSSLSWCLSGSLVVTFMRSRACVKVDG